MFIVQQTSQLYKKLFIINYHITNTITALTFILKKLEHSNERRNQSNFYASTVFLYITLVR